MRENDSNRRGSLTRRDFVTYGGAISGGILLAGCTANDETSGPQASNSRETATDSPSRDATGPPGDPTGLPGDATDSPHGHGSATDDSYSVRMAPVGSVEFDEVPKTWAPYTGDWADMGVALGQGDGLLSIGVKPRFGTYLYEELPGVSVDKSELVQLWQDGTGKELFHALDADVHVIDPNFMVNQLGWSHEDVESITKRVAPFFGNTIFSRSYDWHDGYRYYSMYEAFGKLAAVFRERPRYEAFKSYHDGIIATVHSKLPDETPDVALVWAAGSEPESFYPYLIGEGTASKHWNDLRVGDALAQHGVTDAQAGGGKIDYELLLEIDPDVLAIRLSGKTTEEYFQREIVSYLENHPIASQLSAVQTDNVIYGGLTFQGPIIHLFQLERAAQDLYVDAFGGEQLFDRRRIADIVHGEV